MDQTAKQQVVESIKQATNVLVTVSANPSVDQLSAALGLTLMLSKLEKHATAVFSGQVPEAIKFLEPDKTLESNVDSLRDFIIALDKEKADKLRYKVEDDVVRIFITPYRTKITKDDFQFTQGDFNVDVVVALGVEKREELDNAIIAHGRILHDSTVVTINTGTVQSKLGAINWSDDSASSLCEMLVSVSESFGSGLLDQQISTAYLTGIVAATERFSNDHTSPKVMTMAAQLMAAGANQQLISNELKIEQKAPPIPEVKDNKELAVKEPKQQENEIILRPRSEGPIDEAVVVEPPKDNLAKSEPATEGKTTENQPKQDVRPLKDLENEIANLNDQTKTPIIKARPTLEEMSLPPATSPGQIDEANETQQPIAKPAALSDIEDGSSVTDFEEKPMLGGTFSATSSDAHDETEKTRHQHVFLNQDGAVGDGQTSPIMHAPPIQPVTADLQPEGPNVADLDAARSAVDNAMNTQPFNPSNNPAANAGSHPMSLDGQPQQIQIDKDGIVSHPGIPPDGGVVSSR